MHALHPFFKTLGVAHPIIQAPMAGVATPALAAAVIQSGGLGSLGIGASSVAQARSMIESAQALTNGPLNVNVFCHAPAQRDTARERAWLQHLAPLFEEFGAQPPAALDEIYPTFLTDDAALDMLLALRPAVVSFHFGLPDAARIAALRGSGIRLLASATCLHEARAALAAGVDAIVAQGIEAGGHRGMFDPVAPDERLSTAVLVRQLVQALDVPVIAAGGIMDGASAAAMLTLGASAVQLGTAFVLCPESSANAGYRARLGSDLAGHTRLTATISGRPARGLLNRLITHGEATGAPQAADYPVAYDAAKQLHAAASARGSDDFAAHWAGQGAPLARAMPAAELMQVLVNELREAGY